MRPQSYLLGTTVLVLSFATLGYVAYLALTERDAPPKAALSFAECAAMGFPIEERSPRACRDGAGNTWEETIVAPPPPSQLPPLIAIPVVSSPLPGEKVASPLTVSGEAVGPWFFEASFPISLLGADGVVIAQGVATTSSDWMTEASVPFTATLTWASTTATSGTLILTRDNPSGDPERDRSMTVPVAF